MKHKVLVTGSSGYLGEAVVAALSDHHEVVPLQLRLGEIQPGTLEFDAVIHTAGALRHRSAEHFSANVEGTRCLLEGLAKPTRIIMISSRGVYSPSSTVLTEDSPVGAVDSYGSSKLEAERMLSVSGHPFVILRSTAIYGWSVSQPGMTFPTQAVRSLLAGGPVAVYQPDRPHDYLFVRDLAAWVRILLEPGSHWNQTFNAAGEAGSVTELVSRIATEFVTRCGNEAQLIYRPGPPPVAPVVDCRKIHGELPGLAFTPVGEVVRELVARMSLHPLV